MKKDAGTVNLLELKPKRNSEWETGENDQVVLLVPKFREGFLGKWVQPRLSRPYYRVKLDAYGSYIWRACDGNTTVFEIAATMKDKFKEDLESLYERIGKFVRRLDESKFVLMDAKKWDGKRET
jgi:hypothetical protein